MSKKENKKEEAIPVPTCSLDEATGLQSSSAVVAEVFHKKETKTIQKGEILVLCLEEEGFRRAGMTHKRLTIYQAGELSEKVLKELENDRAFVIVKAL